MSCFDTKTALFRIYSENAGRFRGSHIADSQLLGLKTDTSSSVIEAVGKIIIANLKVQQLLCYVVLVTNMSVILNLQQLLVAMPSMWFPFPSRSWGPGWDATFVVSPAEADPDYYEDKKILGHQTKPDVSRICFANENNHGSKHQTMMWKQMKTAQLQCVSIRIVNRHLNLWQGLGPSSRWSRCCRVLLLVTWTARKIWNHVDSI